MVVEKALQAIEAVELYDTVIRTMGHSAATAQLLEVVRRAANEAGMTVDELRKFAALHRVQLADSVKKDDA